MTGKGGGWLDRESSPLLMPLPTYYNPDTQGVRKPIEKWKFTRTAEEISKHFDAEAELARPLERVTPSEEE